MAHTGRDDIQRQARGNVHGLWRQPVGRTLHSGRVHAYVGDGILAYEPEFSPVTRSDRHILRKKRLEEKFMYIANHNLNTAVDLSALIGSGGGGGGGDNQILIPNTAEINKTNGKFDKFGQLGRMSEKCTSE